MVGIKTLTLLAAAGSALAAPQWGHGHHGGSNIVTENAVVYTTVVVTVTAGQEPTPTPTPEVVQAQPTPEATPEAQPTPAAQPQAAPVASSGGSSSGGYMDIVNQWRSTMGLSSLTQDSTLEANAKKTTDESGGQLNHELNPGSMAQVLAPGDMSEFEKIFVGGWLCEMPSLPGLSAVCGTMSQGWSYDGQTGHAEILSSTKYTKIGCAASSGVCSCDLA